MKDMLLNLLAQVDWQTGIDWIRRLLTRENFEQTVRPFIQKQIETGAIDDYLANVQAFFEAKKDNERINETLALIARVSANQRLLASGEASKNATDEEAERITQDVLRLLGAVIFEPKPVLPLPENAIKIFISYSSKDKAVREKLESHLHLLQRAGYAHVWSDGKLAAGDDWDASIKAALDEANIYLFLVSDNLLNSSYIDRIEIKEALQKVEAGKALAVPIIISPCDWNLKKRGSEEYAFPFAKYQGLPEKGRPISDFTDDDEAFAQIAKNLRGLIDRRFPA